MNIETIEKHAGDYAADRAHLAELVGRLQAELDAVKRRHMRAIREAVGHVADRHDTLRAAIEAAPELFEKPRTRNLMGVKVGYMKQRGIVDCDDEAATIARIEKLLPPEQAELLIRVSKRLHKPAVYDLETRDAKRLGIRISDDEDKIVIKPADGGIDKIVDALLKDAEAIEDAA